MKKLITLLSLIMLVGFTFAQQAATSTSTVQTANKAMQADAKPSTLKVTPPANNAPAAGCSHGAAKSCTKGEAKPACCQQQGGAQGCSGHGTTTKVEEKKGE